MKFGYLKRNVAFPSYELHLDSLFRGHTQLILEHLQHLFHLCDLLFRTLDRRFSLRNGFLNLQFLRQQRLLRR